MDKYAKVALSFNITNSWQINILSPYGPIVRIYALQHFMPMKNSPNRRKRLHREIPLTCWFRIQLDVWIKRKTKMKIATQCPSWSTESLHNKFDMTLLLVTVLLDIFMLSRIPIGRKASCSPSVCQKEGDGGKKINSQNALIYRLLNLTSNEADIPNHTLWFITSIKVSWLILSHRWCKIADLTSMGSWYDENHSGVDSSWLAGSVTSLLSLSLLDYQFYPPLRNDPFLAL